MILIIYTIYSLNCLYLFKLEDSKNILLCFCTIKIENFATDSHLESIHKCSKIFPEALLVPEQVMKYFVTPYIISNSENISGTISKPLVKLGNFSGKISIQQSSFL